MNEDNQKSSVKRFEHIGLQRIPGANLLTKILLRTVKPESTGAKGKEGNTVYNIGRIIKRSPNHLPNKSEHTNLSYPGSSAKNSGAQDERTSFEFMIPQQTSDVNNSISGVNKNDTNSAQFDASVKQKPIHYLL